MEITNWSSNSTCFSSSLLEPKMVSLSSAASVERPSLLHLKVSKTSSIGTFSWNQNLKNSSQNQIPRKQNSQKHKKKKKNSNRKEIIKRAGLLYLQYQIYSFLQHCLHSFSLAIHFCQSIHLLKALQNQEPNHIKTTSLANFWRKKRERDSQRHFISPQRQFYICRGRKRDSGWLVRWC